MSNDIWGPLNFDEETAWLERAESGGAATGFDPVGWEASIWIAHAIYELPGAATDFTHDDARKARLADGIEEPTVIGSVSLDEISIATGGRLGIAGQPSEQWVRIRWSELSTRTGTSMDDHAFPPCFKWFPFRSWPVSMEPPPEGSLDQTSLEALIPHLVDAAPADECIAAYGLVAAGLVDEIRCFRGPISRIQELINPDQRRVGTPSNIWPIDRSWFVYTDWDLWGTRVSGPQSLIDSLVSDQDLETLQWHPPRSSEG